MRAVPHAVQCGAENPVACKSLCTRDLNNVHPVLARRPDDDMRKQKVFDTRIGNQPIAARVARLIDSDRLHASIDRLAAHGGLTDCGVRREALTAAEADARRTLLDEARARGWKTYVDDCANLFFRREGQDDLPPVLTGSHIDTQPGGGRLDGAYGVLARLEVLRALDSAGVTTQHPIEVVAWTNEEGSRFAPGAMGSSAFVDLRCSRVIANRAMRKP